MYQTSHKHHSDILPVGILGTEEVKHLPFTGKIIINIGEIIPYDKNTELVKEKWIESIQKLTGYKYISDDTNKNCEDKQND